MPPLRLQSSKGKLTMSCEIEPVRRPFCRQGSCTFTEVARLAPSGVLDKGFPLKSGSSVDVYIEREMYRCVYINININIYIYIYVYISNHNSNSNSDSNSIYYINNIRSIDGVLRNTDFSPAGRIFIIVIIISYYYY